jgi:hypothetical protein
LLEPRDFPGLTRVRATPVILPHPRRKSHTCRTPSDDWSCSCSPW